MGSYRNHYEIEQTIEITYRRFGCQVLSKIWLLVRWLLVKRGLHQGK